MMSQTQQKREIVLNRKQSKSNSLEEQVWVFFDFLNSDQFIERPSLKEFYVHLVSLYHAAVSHGFNYQRSKRYFLSIGYLLKLEKQKTGTITFLELSRANPVLRAETSVALEQISFSYYTSFPEHEKDTTEPIYRSLSSDMKDVLSDLCKTISFNRIYTEFAAQLPTVSDQLYKDFINHWGSNHCVDLIRAIHWKLNDDFKLHNSK